MIEKILIPYRFKWLGIALILSGSIFTLLYQSGIAVNSPVLAIVSSFMRTRFFIVFHSNVADELALFSFILGFILLSVSREKNEKPGYPAIRAKSILYALILNTVFIILSLMFIFGSAFITVLVLNTFSFFVFYLVCFLVFKSRSKH